VNANTGFQRDAAKKLKPRFKKRISLKFRLPSMRLEAKGKKLGRDMFSPEAET